MVQDTAPSDPMFELPVKACSRVVTLQGVAPGAEVTVLDTTNGAVLGTSTGGTVVEVASELLTTASRIAARTTSCGGAPGQVAPEPPIDQMLTVASGSRQLINAPLDQPMRSCQIILGGKDFQPGTTLEIGRDDGTIVAWQPSARQSNLRLSPGLRENEHIRWRIQALPGCKLSESELAYSVAEFGGTGQTSHYHQLVPWIADIALFGTRARRDGADSGRWCRQPRTGRW